MVGSKIDYQRLRPQDDDDEGRSTAAQILEEADRRSAQVRKLLLISIVTLVISACFFVISIYMRLTTQSSPTMLECAKMTSPYSPIWEAIEFEEGEFINFFNHSTIYRGPPTREREEAWDELWNHFGLAVDQEGLAALNKTAEYIPVVGSDPDHPTYGANVEVFHQLHCLNVIRQYTWPLEQFDPSWGELYPGPPGNETIKDRVAARMHVDHCIETLRLSLMCYGDITPVMVEKDLSRKLRSKADFNVHHKCRNFDKIVEYVDAKAIDIPPQE